MAADRFERDVLLDFLLTVVWPGMHYYVATAGQTDFDLRSSWDTANDIIIYWRNGTRNADGAATWVDADTVRLPAAVDASDRIHVLISPGAGANYVPRAGSVAFLANVNAGGFRLTNLATSVNASDAVRRDEVVSLALSAGDTSYLRKDGTNWPPLANLAMGTFRFTGLGAGVDPNDSVRKAQVALLDGTQAFTAEQQGVDPTNAAGLATKNYVDNAVSAAVAIDKRATVEVVQYGNGKYANTGTTEEFSQSFTVWEQGEVARVIDFNAGSRLDYNANGFTPIRGTSDATAAMHYGAGVAAGTVYSQEYGHSFATIAASHNDNDPTGGLTCIFQGISVLAVDAGAGTAQVRLHYRVVTGPNTSTTYVPASDGNYTVDATVGGGQVDVATVSNTKGDAQIRMAVAFVGSALQVTLTARRQATGHSDNRSGARLSLDARARAVEG